jgi:MFS family permease
VIPAAFRVRSFRFQWPSDLLTSWAFEMETIVLGWYLMSRTGSVLLLSVFASLQYGGTLAAPLFGVVGDRLGGRATLCVMRGVYTGLAALLATLALAGWLTPGWALAVSAVAGLVRPNDLVLRTMLIGETIPPAALMGAIGISRAITDSARIAGALAGASLSALLGVGATYLLVTAFYGASLALTFGVATRPAATDPAASPPLGAAAPSGWRDLRDGLVHVVQTPALLAMMLLAFLVNVTAYPISHGLLPYVAQRVFLTDAAGLGWLAASFALGGLVGSMATVVTGGPARPARVTLVGIGLWYAALLGFGRLRRLGPGVAVLLVAGLVQNLAMISMTATLLLHAGGGFRGRVMGVRTLAVYGLPLGLLAFGVLVEHIGYSLTLTLASGVGLVFTALIAVRWRGSLWDRR